jgi:hypothetical protein
VTWATIPVESGEVHVVPDDDLRPHREISCWCQPRSSMDDDMVIVHNSMDGREAFETGERKPS